MQTTTTTTTVQVVLIRVIVYEIIGVHFTTNFYGEQSENATYCLD